MGKNHDSNKSKCEFLKFLFFFYLSKPAPLDGHVLVKGSRVFGSRVMLCTLPFPPRTLQKIVLK